ncbi:hypothetical protein Leryth_026248 [Lithospermum erythrorhizon]|nr:hypothetical protein Leryth_026248 [Lithospermum erythrorhizon]
MPSLPLPLFILLLLLPYTTSSNPYNYSIHVDCGGPTDSTDVFGVQWLSDRHFSGGATAIVSEPLLFHHTQEKTLRYFPISSGKKNCYSIPLAGDHISAGQKFVAKKKFVAGKNFVDGEKFVVGEKFVDGGGGGGGGGRYLVRTFTVYDNYNGKHHTPSFDVSVSGTVVFSWRSPWPESVSRGGAYSDLIVSVPEDHGEIDVCFYSIATDAPLIASLELFQIDPDAYVNGPVLNSSILVNYGRFSAGSGQWGPGFSNDTDRFGRSWQSDAGHRSRAAALATGSTIKAISALKKVVNADRAPNYFPPKLYESAVTIIGEGGGFLEYELQVDAKLDYLLWFHFAEINLSVTKAGQRVFDVIVNGENVSRVDIFKEVGGFSAYDFSYVVKNLSSTTLNVRIESVAGRPLICGLENYAIVPADLKTVPDQVIAMKALKESLRVPDRMGWNGDPCAPTTWDAWEGVTCRMNKDETALVISQIDLGSQGLKGYISDQISLLTNLASLNLSSNSLQGTLPSGLGQKSLVKLGRIYCCCPNKCYSVL